MIQRIHIHLLLHLIASSVQAFTIAPQAANHAVKETGMNMSLPNASSCRRSCIRSHLELYKHRHPFEGEMMGVKSHRVHFVDNDEVPSDELPDEKSQMQKTDFHAINLMVVCLGSIMFVLFFASIKDSASLTSTVNKWLSL